MPRDARRVWNLAQAIAARYAAIERRWPAMSLVFEQSDRAGVSVANTYYTAHSSLFMNPRVLLRLLVPHRSEKPYVVADGIPVQPIDVNMTVAASSRPPSNSQEQDDVIARIVRRGRRDEFPPAVNGRPAGRTPVHAVQVEPEESATSRHSLLSSRVYRRASSSKDEASAVTAASRTEREQSSATRGRDIGTAATGQPPVDIARITDQVLHVLDRRIVAQRERMGVN
jgi:hypothetical protein